MTLLSYSFVDRPVPAGVVGRVHTVPVGCRLVCVESQWETLLLVLESRRPAGAGPARGGTLCLKTGALFSPRGLVPAVLLATGTVPAVLTSVGRRDQGEH